jgi:hypothetical protein
MIGDAPVTGRARDISAADIRNAIIAADATPGHANGKIQEVHVIGRDEVHLYRTPRGDFELYDGMRRRAGRWYFDGTTEVGKEPVG